MPRSRGRNPKTHSPHQARRAEEAKRYRQSIDWAKSLVMRAAGWLVSMAVVVIGVRTLGPKFTFSTYGAMVVAALAAATLLVLKAKGHDRRFRHFNGLMPVAARIAPPDRIRRPY